MSGTGGPVHDELVFPFRFEPRFRPLLAALGVRSANSDVRLTADDRLIVRFGRWRLDTPLANVVGTSRTGPYRWFKAIGARGSFVDRGVTFGSSTDAGVCIRLGEPVPALLPGSFLTHPGVTVTVEEPDALEAAVRSRAGIV